MKIEKITDIKDIISILEIEDPHLDDQVLKKTGCSRIEWIQWMQNMMNKGNCIAIWGIKKNDKIKAYLIALNSVMPPISRSVYILYQNFFGIKNEDGIPYYEEMLEILKNWARSIGAKRLCIQTDYPHVNSRLGFKEEGHSMVMEI